MSTIQIDSDALFRAVTATGYKLLVYTLDLDTGEIHAQTMRADEIPDAPQGPSVLPLPKMGGDLTGKKDAAPFGPPPVETKKKLFNDDTPKKPAFEGGFWSREEKKRGDLFGEGGFRRESSAKKLAEIFGEGPAKKKPDPFAKAEAPAPPSAPSPAAPTPPPASAPAPISARNPRIPPAGEQMQLTWIAEFARDCGDPQIRDEIRAALKHAKPFAGFERVLRKYQRMNQQWERYFRKQALAYGEAWLTTLSIQWELLEPENAGRHV
jgi:hypothetical protein